jgi:hypothetical protein
MTAPWQTAAEQAATLGSVYRLNGHPLFAMTYHGATPPTHARAELLACGGTGPGCGVGCSVFTTAGNTGRPVVGRNFDFEHHPAMVVWCNPPGCHASVSFADISYLGFDLDNLDDIEEPERNRALLLAPLLPFDGMNDQGVVVAMAAVPDWQLASRPGRPRAGSVSILRPVLDRADSTADAVDIFTSYDIDFEDDPPLHYMFADATGSAVVELVGGRPAAQWRRGAWQLMVNFTLEGSTPAERDADRRYSLGVAKLDQAGGRLDWRQAFDVLAAVAQDDTQWSTVYEPADRTIHVATGHRFHQPHRLTVTGSV